MREIIIPKGTPSTTLQSFLKKKFPVGYVRKLFRKDGVRVNGKRGKTEMNIKGGDVLTFYVRFEQQEPTVSAQAVRRLEFLYEDEDFAVVNKKAGVAVHEGKSVALHQSLIGQLIEYYKPKKITPWLVHRLDRDTSGCLLVVKKESLKEPFEKMFEEGKVEKEYITLVKGILKQKRGEITISLPGRDQTLVNALTLYEVQNTFSGADVSLVKAKIETGRMHQIRLHFAKIGHPVVMDDEHGDFSFNKIFRKMYPLKRQFLHAAHLSFVFRERPFTIEAPLPLNLRKTLEKLS